MVERTNVTNKARGSSEKPASQRKPAVPRYTSDAESSAAKIFWMQQTLGNQVVQQRASTCSAFSTCPTGGACHPCPYRVQTKSLVSQPGDQYEQEAGRIAEVIAKYAPVGEGLPADKQATVPQLQRQSFDYNRESQKYMLDSGEASSEDDQSIEEVQRPQAQSATTEIAAASEAPSPLEAATNESEAQAKESPDPDGHDMEVGARADMTSSSLVVEDSATELQSGQMKRSEFISGLRSAISATAEEALSGTGRSAKDCPYIDYWFNYYSGRDSDHINRAIQKYAPETAGAETAGQVISIISARVRRAVELWSTTGEVTGVPEGGQVNLPGAKSSEKIEPATGASMLHFKAREGGARGGDDPQAIQSQLGSGSPLNSNLRSRMESAFNYDFSHVRVHTDAGASNLTNDFNARAFTVGNHIAFGAGEYHPGSLIGDALIAHELAHVAQQAGANSVSEPLPKAESANNALEEDADYSAVGAVVSIWGQTKKGLTNVSQNAMPRLSSGLRLSRCNSAPELKTPTGTSKLKSRTVSDVPADRDRTKLGLGEEVDLSLDPPIAVTWSVTGGGAVNPVAGASTRFTASQSPSKSKITATLGTETVSQEYKVIEPSGMKSSLITDSPLGIKGPPNNRIGANSKFDCIVQPTDVSFYQAKFRENIPGESFTWPDGTAGNRPATTVAWTPDKTNKTTDDVNSALDPIARLMQGGRFVGFSYSVRVPEEYQNNVGTWVSWLPNEDHPRQYSSSDQSTRVSIVASNTERGGWQGPWQ